MAIVQFKAHYYSRISERWNYMFFCYIFLFSLSLLLVCEWSRFFFFFHSGVMWKRAIKGLARILADERARSSRCWAAHESVSVYTSLLFYPHSMMFFFRKDARAAWISSLSDGSPVCAFRTSIQHHHDTHSWPEEAHTFPASPKAHTHSSR